MADLSDSKLGLNFGSIEEFYLFLQEAWMLVSDGGATASFNYYGRLKRNAYPIAEKRFANPLYSYGHSVYVEGLNIMDHLEFHSPYRDVCFFINEVIILASIWDHLDVFVSVDSPNSLKELLHRAAL